MENYFKPEVLNGEAESDEWIAAALAVTLANGKNGSAKEMPTPITSSSSKWKKRKLES